jgi:hypothetical protein
LRKRKVVFGWVIYKSRHAGEHGPNAVCDQAEWDAMELADPKAQTLLRCGIASEAQAEALARELPGGTAAKAATLRAR